MSFTTENTEDQQVFYVMNEGHVCPYCEADGDIQGNGGIEISEGYALQEVFCGTCASSWTDVYTLVGFNPTEA